MKRLIALLALLACGQAFAQTHPTCYPPFAVNWSSSMTSQPPALGTAFIETWFCPDPAGKNGYKGYDFYGYVSELLPNWYVTAASLSVSSKASLDALWDSILPNDLELDGIAQAQLANTCPPATGFLRGLLPPPVTTGGTAFYVIQQTDKFVAIPVGTVPAGVACDTTQSLNGMSGVPRASVTWFGTVKPLAVLAVCQ